MRQMYTKPQVKKANNRYYVEFYYRGERLREYNGSKISLSIFPNKAKTAKERSILLQELKIEFAKALDDNWNPFTGQRNARHSILHAHQTTKSKAINQLYNADLLLLCATTNYLGLATRINLPLCNLSL